MAQTILESLKGINAYPIPMRALVMAATERGLDLTKDATQEVFAGKAYNLAVADLLMWLTIAPDVSQGGQSYGFTDEQRRQLRSKAFGLYGKFGEDTSAHGVVYGYKGSRL